MDPDWFVVDHLDVIDTPSLLIYPDRIQYNIDTMIRMAGGTDRLWPHVKTHKMKEVIEMQMQRGLKRFKCATIAEAEMLALCGAEDILLAYQPVGPKVRRLLQLIREFPYARFSALVDNINTAAFLSDVFEDENLYLGIFLDIDVGQHRTGINTIDALSLYEYCIKSRGLITRGLHVYDGHVRESDLEVRTQRIDEGFVPVKRLVDQIQSRIKAEPLVIAGGTPAFSVHAKREWVICSPGTVLLWDWGYHSNYQEMDFQFAALVLSRIISKPSHNRLCVDLGHKSVAADQPLPRVHFLNLPEAVPIAHSEEHLVLEVKDNSSYQIGSVLYGVPTHICPTCALHEYAHVVRKGLIQDQWSVMSRRRKISI